MNKTCQAHIQCPNNFEQGAYGPVVCLDGVCVCTPSLGYTGQDCNQPSTITIYYRAVFIVMLCLQILMICIVIRTLNSCGTLTKIFRKKRMSCWRCYSGSHSIHPEQYGEQEDSFNFRDTVSSSSLLVGLCLLILVVSDILSTFTDPAFHIRRTVYGLCFFFIGIFHSAIHLEIGLNWFELSLKLSRNTTIENNLEDIKAAVRAICVSCAIIFGAGVQMWIFLSIEVMVLSCGFITFVTIAIGVVLSRKLNHLQNFNSVLRQQVAKIKQATQYSILLVLGVVSCTLVAQSTFLINGWLSGTLYCMVIVLYQLYHVTILNYISPLRRSTPSTRIFVQM